ncbi:MAG: B12-binding domain-containing radical SAM protein [Candidatus Omnitrophica bacterium]|nr:B12-binding domain-containing radical SAM protein [Candidatus Omnitrophota bacterium]
MCVILNIFPKFYYGRQRIKNNMKIAFIYPPQTHKYFEEDIDIVSREFGVFPPLGLAYAAAINEQAGNKSIIIDANAEKLKLSDVLSRLRQFKPDMLGFLLTAYGFFDALPWVRFLKKETGLPVLAGNVLCNMYPETIMRYPEFDYLIIGPATESLPLLVDRIKKSQNLGGISGVAWRCDGKVVIVNPATFKEDFSKLPFPARHLLPNHRYHAIMSKRKNYTIMITSKGCDSKCTFCHIHGIPVSFRPEEMVVAEMEECYLKFGIREMDIFDPSFTMKRERVFKICEGIIKKGIDIHWACRTRVDQVDQELLNIMSKAGCKRILYGIESGVDDNLRKMQKGIIVNQAKRAVDLTKKANIKSLGFFMLGVPGETTETLNQTIRYSREIGLDYAQFHRTMAKPGTELSKQANDALGYDYWKEYISGCVMEKRLPTPWMYLSDRIIQKSTKYAYLKFYFRPRYLLGLIAGIRSWHELKRYGRSALGLLLSRRDR